MGYGVKLKEFKCTNCKRETYAYYKDCSDCEMTNTIIPIDRTLEEVEMRERLHIFIDCLDYKNLRYLMTQLSL